MIVSLASSGFRQLRLTVVFDADYNVVRKTWESAGFDTGHPHGKDFHYRELAGYRRGGVYYRVEAMLFADAEESSSITLDYSFGKIRKLRTRRTNLDKIGLFIDDLASPCSVICSAGGILSSDNFRPIVDLPLIRFNSPREYFDEVRGIRLVRLGEGAEDDSVTLDVFDDKELYVYAQTNFASRLSSILPSKALDRLTELKDNAVTAIQQKGSEQ